MVRLVRENALSQRGTGARRENPGLLFFFPLGLAPSFLAARASYPSDSEENKRLLPVYHTEISLRGQFKLSFCSVNCFLGKFPLKSVLLLAAFVFQIRYP